MAPITDLLVLGSSPLFFLFLFPLSLLLLLVLSTKRVFFYTKANLPPSPPKLPFIGNLHQIGSFPHRSLRAISSKHGDLVLLRLGQIPTLLVSSADMAREIMRTQDAIFASRPALKVAQILLYDCMSLSFSPYGDRWKNLRKLSTAHLLSAKRVLSYKLGREEEVASMIRRVGEASRLSDPIDMGEELFALANDVVCRAVAGKCFREEGRRHLFRMLIEENVSLFGEFYVEDYFPSLWWLDGVFGSSSSRAKKNVKKWDNLLDQMIKEHEDHGSRDGGEEDFVDVLLSLRKDPELEFELTEEHVKGLLVDMLAAGTDTTYVALEWAMAELVCSPEAMKKLQAEVRAATASQDGMVSASELNSMSYLKAVVKETLRLHPPAPLLLPRESIRDCIDLKGYHVAEGTRVIINAWAIGRDPRYWDAPDEFCPERFYNSEVDFKGCDFQLIPFGAGRRICPGMQFAVSTIELALANLVRGFDWELPRGLERTGLDMSEAPRFIICRKKRLQLIAKTCGNL
ncbi:cytochrome P450 71A1-like [Typha angustifolia]|uniref:cytochrome P450 71A1-like n=1 Tax=Typha angustifolia TaxID=59011 RepID=UPI003C2F081C